MRKFLKKNILEIFQTMYEAHSDIKKLMEKKDLDSVNVILGDCQNTAVQIGNAIESSEGEGFVTVGFLEEYCEFVYQVASDIGEFTGTRAQKALDKKLIKAENSVKNDVKVRLEIVFCPYKASMWDSLESVWKAADEDPDCDAYVVPIPYYDRNPDYSFGEFHYEGGDYPDYVPITHYEAYNFEARQPDVIYIHNPYDEYNNVTSVDPRFYSHELKKNTECLVYIPYYATAGGMSEAQKSLSAYYHADYIVAQSEKHINFFDERLPKGKLLPFGSPKYDKVINMCKNPPAPPANWLDKIAGKRVFFYNTSLGGMLADTEVFLKKMQYVFETFAKHPEVCLLWRPHPLLESTFDSMRPAFKEWFDKLKEFFLVNNLGIYDNTPDIANTIALSDCYIGDSGTSVTSLFGIAGKPLFIFNNYINTVPEQDDWRGEIIRYFNPNSDFRWLVTRQNKLFYSPNNDFSYKYVCSLSKYSNGGYYLYALSNNEKTYICPANAEDVIVVSQNGIQKRIDLEKYVERAGAFSGAVLCGEYIFLIPNRYPAVVRINTRNDSVTYIKGYSEIITQMVYNVSTTGGFAALNGYLYISSPLNNNLIAIEAETCKVQVLSTGGSGTDGCLVMQAIGEELLFIPMKGYNVRLWSPETGTLRNYNVKTDDLVCVNELTKCYSDDRPFYYSAVYDNSVYLSPLWSNKHIKLDLVDGKSSVWEPPFTQEDKYKNGYYFVWGKGCFVTDNSDGKNLYFSTNDRKFYLVDMKNMSSEEIHINFDVNELRLVEAGFGRYSQWLQYCCEENSFNTLEDFISDNITGGQFDKNEQIKAFGENAANPDGTCGRKTHDFMKSKVMN